MSRKRGRTPTFNLESRKHFAHLIEQYGVRGAREASNVPVSLATLRSIAKEFGIRLQGGGRPLDAWRIAEPVLSDLQMAQIERLLACGPMAAGYRSDQWTCRRISDVVRKSLGVRCHPIHLKSLLSKLGLHLVERRTFLIRADKSVVQVQEDDVLKVASESLKAA